MGSQKKRLAEAREKLSRLQAKQKAMAEKIERARRRLEKRANGLRKVEAKIVQAERRAFELAHPHGEPGLSAVPLLQRAYLIFNPNSGQDAKDVRSPQRVLEALRAHGIQAQMGVKTSGKIARQLTRQAVKAKHTLVIVAGGDGTIEDVASQLVGTDTALGILPVGTRNNLARELGVPLDLNQACELLAGGITRKIDVGRVRTDESKDVAYFLESAGLGLSAVILPAGQALEKGRLWKISFALRKMFELKPGPIEIELDNGEKVTASSQLVTVSNAPLLGASLLVAPEAKMDDGQLDVAVYDEMSTTELVSYFMATTHGRRSYDPHVRFYRAGRVVIRSAQSLPGVSDKDPIQERHELAIDVIAGALNAVVGDGAALTVPVEAVPSVPPLAGPQPTDTGPNPKNGASAIKPAGEPVPA